MEIDEILKIALNNNDANRPRSLQKELGASSIYSCRRQAWSFLNDVPTTNHGTDKLAAMFGTALHDMIAKSMLDNDPFDDFIVEEEFKTDMIKGHIDLYIKSQKQVVDWKTMSKAKIKAGNWVDAQKIAQIQIYGYLLEENGYPVEWVSLVAIPRDGTMADISLFKTEYDRDIALQGIEWAKEVQASTEPPAPEKKAWFCSKYCKYYDRTGEVGCPSL